MWLSTVAVSGERLAGVVAFCELLLLSCSSVLEAEFVFKTLRCDKICCGPWTQSVDKIKSRVDHDD